MVVATFGRGFYVLDNYSSLRELSKTVAKEEAHLFEINDALLYFPSSNLSYQGDVHFRIPNPTPSVKFEYYIKQGFESLKQKRKKEFVKNEKAGNFKYPTKQELLEEKYEVKPRLFFTVYNKEGAVMRKITKSFK